MRVCYHHGAPCYTRDAEHRRYGRPIGNRASAKRVDALVEELFLTLVNARTVSQSWSYQEKLREEAKAIDRHWQQKLHRVKYQADLARRRYEQVDPANRRVAQTLETEWNQRLEELSETQQTYKTQRPSAQDITSTHEHMRKI